MGFHLAFCCVQNKPLCEFLHRPRSKGNSENRAPQRSRCLEISYQGNNWDTSEKLVLSFLGFFLMESPLWDMSGSILWVTSYHIQHKVNLFLIEKYAGKSWYIVVFMPMLICDLMPLMPWASFSGSSCILLNSFSHDLWPFPHQNKALPQHDATTTIRTVCLWCCAVLDPNKALYIYVSKSQFCSYLTEHLFLLPPCVFCMACGKLYFSTISYFLPPFSHLYFLKCARSLNLFQEHFSDCNILHQQTFLYHPVSQM